MEGTNPEAALHLEIQEIQILRVVRKVRLLKIMMDIMQIKSTEDTTKNLETRQSDKTIKETTLVVVLKTESIETIDSTATTEMDKGQTTATLNENTTIPTSDQVTPNQVAAIKDVRTNMLAKSQMNTVLRTRIKTKDKEEVIHVILRMKVKNHIKVINKQVKKTHTPLGETNIKCLGLIMTQIRISKD